jgi:hypothetical protein
MIVQNLFLLTSIFLFFQRAGNQGDQFFINNWLQLWDNNPLWVSKNQRNWSIPSPLGYRVILRINSFISIPWTHLQTLPPSKQLIYYAKFGLKKQNM